MASAAGGGHRRHRNQEAATVEDGTGPSTRRGLRRLPDGALPAALLAGLLVLVADGVGGTSHNGRGRHVSRIPLRIGADVALGAVVVVVVLVAGAFARALRARRKKAPPAQRVYQAPTVPWALRIALLLLLLLLGAGFVALSRSSPPDRRARPAPPATGELPLEQPPPAGGRAGGADAAAIAAIAVVGVTAAALLARRGGGRREVPHREMRAGDQPADTATTGDLRVDDLLAEPNP
ncbi:MAG: hypothetical protein LC792_10355, partial [Actinobacteria bacterium]|nr:hypothetical protein [Actinomycetota bacterium]